MWITHPQTGKSMRTDMDIRVRCEDCLLKNPNTQPITKIKIVRLGNRDRLVCVNKHYANYGRHDR